MLSYGCDSGLLNVSPNDATIAWINTPIFGTLDTYLETERWLKSTVPTERPIGKSASNLMSLAAADLGMGATVEGAKGEAASAIPGARTGPGRKSATTTGDGANEAIHAMICGDSTPIVSRRLEKYCKTVTCNAGM